ncbi:MAG: restriction endonuclease subunit S [Tannerella sp.]|jgi:type I restriction enzyme S subunit|nr:restriction endonuclease subunit S [Tannerella sp.]
MKPYPKYKATNIPWLTEAPDDWEVWKIKYLFSERIEKGFPDEPLLVASQNMGVVPKEVYGNRTVEAMKDLHLLKLVEIGDFVISLRSFQGGIEYAYYRGIISPAYTVMKQNTFIDAGYFRYLAKSKLFIELLQTCVTGIREGQNIDYNRLKNEFIPLPPLSVQSRIVSYLDAKVSSINKLIEAKKRQVELLKEELYTYLFSEKGDIESLGYWDNCFPQHWESTTVKRIFHETSDKGYTDKELLAVTQDRGVLYKNDCSENFVSPSGDYSSQKLVLPHDFIISLRSFQGGIEASLIKGLVSPAYTVFAMNDYNELLFIYYRYLFKTKPFIAFLNTLVADTRDGKKIGFKEFRGFYMPVPPVSHLEKIKELSLRLDVLVIQVEKYLQLLTEYKISLISDVVTGKVEVQEVALQQKIESEVVLPKIIELAPKQSKTHSKGYDDAVILATLVNAFGTEEYPFTAFDCQKFPYLLHRYIEGVAANYSKFAAGPYNPLLKYQTARPIALKKKYIREHTGRYKGLVTDANVQEAVGYFTAWYGNEPLEWIKQFRFISNRKNELELLTTVDMAIVDLQNDNMSVTMQSIKDLIKGSPVWKDKLKRPIFSDDNIERAIKWSYKLFGTQNKEVGKKL